MPKIKGSPSHWTKQLFLSSVEIGKGGCWFLPTNKTSAHRIAYRLYNGNIPKIQKKGCQIVSLFVCHKCDVPSCCNPDHLFLGTCKDNNGDRAKKGRSYRPTGELNVMKRSELKMARTGNGNPMFGREHSEEAKLKIGAANRGDLSESKRSDARVKLSASGKAVTEVVCERCKRIMKPWNYARWHGENCNG